MSKRRAGRRSFDVFADRSLPQQKGGVLLLVDPDRHQIPEIEKRVSHAAASGVKAILVGSSFMASAGFQKTVRACRKACDLPVVLFPGSGAQLSDDADAILLLSLISGRNPELLIGEHVRFAPAIKRLGLQVLPTGYMLIDSGGITSVQFMSNTMPLPRDKPDLVAAHALAGELLGLKLIYMDAGSGAKQSIPIELIRAVAKTIEIPLIVGGGVRSPRQVEATVGGGASFVVVGTAIEEAPDRSGLLAELVAAATVSRLLVSR
ncbi:MAG: geranylgeranylglyceryl/heptaprenylglyceryl phosphate synthase [Gemmatimonadetes bacterium]|nr:geranylgeranylglyceryl/heptaprenylglyceryl phosphate synthase [Gemmatimonadota bacterium]